MTKKDEKIIGDIMGGLMDGFNKETVNIFNEKKLLLEKLGLRFNNVSATDIEYNNAKLNGFIRGFLLKEFGDNTDLEFLVLNYEFISKHFGFIIKQKEGLTCYADKVGFIMSSLLRFFIEKKEIDFSPVISKGEEYDYHIPKKVFYTHDKIVDYFIGLLHLYYGNPTRYLSQYKDVIINYK